MNESEFTSNIITQISDFLSDKEVKSRFKVLGTLDRYLSGVLDPLVEAHYVDIANDLRSDIELSSNIKSYVELILGVLTKSTKFDYDVKKASEEFYRLIEQIEKREIVDPEGHKNAMDDYLKNIESFIET